MGNFDDANLQKAYTCEQGKDDKTATIAMTSLQIGRKLQAQKNTAFSPGLNIAPSKYPSITLGLTQEDSEDSDVSLLGGSSLAIDPTGGNICLLGGNAYLTGDNAYPPGNGSLVISTATGHTSTSKVKHNTFLPTQEFNANLKK